mmetsp:Transcript_1490/g.5492  ORF Transcript_1490/g.5492 Transcript_1490/m.5492 type:complete len:215 (-) Transcript_1490:115-759(-)
MDWSGGKIGVHCSRECLEDFDHRRQRGGVATRLHAAPETRRDVFEHPAVVPFGGGDEAVDDEGGAAEHGCGWRRQRRGSGAHPRLREHNALIRVFRRRVPVRLFMRASRRPGSCRLFGSGGGVVVIRVRLDRSGGGVVQSPPRELRLLLLLPLLFRELELADALFGVVPHDRVRDGGARAARVRLHVVILLWRHRRRVVAVGGGFRLVLVLVLG